MRYVLKYNINIFVLNSTCINIICIIFIVVLINSLLLTNDVLMLYFISNKIIYLTPTYYY